jgi:hypothetical protein
LKGRLLYVIFFSILFCSGCSCNKKKSLDTRISLWRMDRIPYGTRYAYDNLRAIFPHAEIRTSSRFPVLHQNDDNNDTLRALIILTPSFYPEPEEMKSLIRFATAGNHVFISSRFFDDSIFSFLHMHLEKTANRQSANVSDSIPIPDTSGRKSSSSEYGSDENNRPSVSVLDPYGMKWVNYSYPGTFSGNHFSELDTVHVRTLGRNQQGEPDFIRISFASGGAVYFHLEPRAFSNFFLLHGENKSYYDQALSWLPEKTGAVEWSDYFRYSHHGENYSAFRYILSNRSLRWAFWLTLILFMLFFLVESKRKQRAIGLIPKQRNASVDFVKTVSRLYLQQKNNQNLALKMIAAFLENIRTAYNLSTSVLNEEFALKLAFRTGRPLQEIQELLHSIHDARLKTNLTDREIMDLHQKITQFDKPAL